MWGPLFVPLIERSVPNLGANRRIVPNLSVPPDTSTGGRSMKLLHIDSSISGDGSATRQISAAVTAALARANPGLQIVRRDLDADPIPHLDSRNLASVRPSPDLPPPLTADVDANAAILEEFLDADVVVIGAPMYNFGVPSQLKAWLDRVLVPGQTFSYSEKGPVGLAGGKKVIIA